MNHQSEDFRFDILQGLLGGIGDGALLTDCDGRVTYANDAALKIIGVSKIAEGAYFSDICPLIYLETGESFPNPIKQALDENHSVGLARNVGLWRDGKPVYLSLTCSPMRDAVGSISGCSLIMRDITRMRRMEIKIENDHYHMRSVFSAAKIGLCILDEGGRIVEINEAGLEIMETTYEEALNLQFGDALRCENSSLHGCGHSDNCRHCPVRKNLEAAIMDDQYANEFNVSLTSVRSGEPIWLKVFVSQTWTESGKQIIVALLDESVRKKREQALEEAREAAEAIARAKDQFMANMSHEIRTPINGLNGMIDLTLRTNLTKEQRENLISARQCSEDLLSIINDILDFSKLESGHMKIENISVDLHTLLKQIVAVQGAAAKAKGLVFVKPDLKKLPRFIQGDPLRIRQMLNNLLNNAIKFTENGAVSLEATAHFRRKHSRLEFAVHDTGIGIDPQNRRKLFQPFSQIDGSITRRFGGTGLGLMIVKQLVEAMGGTIQVFSTYGRGSTFRLQLPLTLAEKSENEASGRRLIVKPIRKKRSDGSTAQSADNRTVVAPAFDDDPDLAKLLAYCENKLNGGS